LARANMQWVTPCMSVDGRRPRGLPFRVRFTKQR
jgi:hypothetical protein